MSVRNISGNNRFSNHLLDPLIKPERSYEAITCSYEERYPSDRIERKWEINGETFFMKVARCEDSIKKYGCCKVEIAPEGEYYKTHLTWINRVQFLKLLPKKNREVIIYADSGETIYQSNSIYSLKYDDGFYICCRGKCKTAKRKITYEGTPGIFHWNYFTLRFSKFEKPLKSNTYREIPELEQEIHIQGEFKDFASWGDKKIFISTATSIFSFEFDRGSIASCELNIPCQKFLIRDERIYVLDEERKLIAFDIDFSNGEELAEKCDDFSIEKAGIFVEKGRDLFLRRTGSRRIRQIYYGERYQSLQGRIGDELFIQPHINLHQASCLPQKTIFGKDWWQRCFGVDIGYEPPLPSNIEEVLNQESVFFQNQTVGDTSFVVLIPQLVNGEPLTFDHSCIRNRLKLFRADELRSVPIEQYRWVIITRESIPDSLGRDYLELEGKLSEVGYDFPPAIDAFIAGHVALDIGRPLKGENTYCQELLVDYALPALVWPPGEKVRRSSIREFFEGERRETGVLAWKQLEN